MGAATSMRTPATIGGHGSVALGSHRLNPKSVSEEHSGGRRLCPLIFGATSISQQPRRRHNLHALTLTPCRRADCRAKTGRDRPALLKAAAPPVAVRCRAPRA